MSRDESPLDVLFVVRSLNVGGAERQLTTLATALDAAGHRVAVAQCYAGGPFEAPLRDAGIPLHDLRKRSRWDLFGCARRLRRLVARRRPRVVYSFMPEANVIAAVAMLPWPLAPLCWGVRASDVQMQHYDRAAHLVFGLTRALARVADVIIYNSHSGRAHHEASGYPAGRGVVVPNGIDADRYQPAPEAGRVMREAWQVPATTTLVGVVGRIDPMKGHPIFLQAVARIAGRFPAARFAIVGGDAAAWEPLRASAAALGIAERMVWIPQQSDMPAVYSALDVLVLPSIFGEGFPNVVGEAMACEIPCVVSEAGDNALVVGDTGRTAPVGDHEGLAAALSDILALAPETRRAMGRRARARVLAEFSVATLVDRTLAALPGLRPRR